MREIGRAAVVHYRTRFYRCVFSFLAPAALGRKQRYLNTIQGIVCMSVERGLRDTMYVRDDHDDDSFGLWWNDRERGSGVGGGAGSVLFCLCAAHHCVLAVHSRFT